MHHALDTEKGGFSTWSVMTPAQASDQWASWQSKSIKGCVYELRKENFEMDLKTIKGQLRALAAEYNKRIASYKEK